MTKELDLSKPMQTRDGRKVRLLCDDLQSSTSKKVCVFAITTPGSRVEYTVIRGADGKITHTRISKHDIINVPATREVWVNVYRIDGKIRPALANGTKEDADREAGKNRVACQKITLTEGQFDD